MSKKSILLVDDHGILLEGTKSLLSHSTEYEVKDTADSGSEAMTLLKENDYDIMISDYEMPGISGAELVKIAKKLQPEIKIIILSMHDDPSVVRALLKSGINAYLLKKDSPEILLEALEKVLKGRRYLSDDISDILIDRIDDDKQVLSSREQEILKLIAKEYSTKQIAEILFISDRTVETHRKNIIRKTGVKTVVGLLKYAYENGIAQKLG